MRVTSVATDYDDVRSDVKDSQDNSLQVLQVLQDGSAPDARSGDPELDGADGLDKTSPCFV
jgi:hypothetical protein